jgi:type I restriction enzyme S subunit
MTDIRPGYKQTEVGVIPEDWEVKTVGEIAEVKTGPFGSALHEKDYVANGTPIITVEHLGERGIYHSNLPMVSDADKARLKAYSIRSGDLVFSRVGSVDRNALVRAEESGWLFSGRLLRVRVKNKDTDSHYLSFHFHSESFKQRVRDVAVGQTMASINTKILMGVSAIIPPTIAEQEAIAQALSNTDALIESLEQLVTKKRHIKQGIMQELLTGKRRLPGFIGEWEIKRLDAVLKFQVGFPFSSEFFNEEGHGIRLVKNRDLKNDGQMFHYSGKYEQEFLLQNGDVLVGMDGDFLPCLWAKGVALLNQRVGRIVTLAGLDCVFVFYCLLRPLKEIENVTSSTTVKHLSHGDIEGIEMRLPSIEEQTAIATILSDMDAEIAALETKLTKTRFIKQGMMHELLTGKIRLI